MQMRRLWVFAVVGLALAVGLAGCADGSGATGVTEATTTSSAATNAGSAATATTTADAKSEIVASTYSDALTVVYDENDLNINASHEIEGLASCLDYFRAVDALDPASARIQQMYDGMFAGNKYLMAAGSAATGMYRGMMLWAAAVKEAGRLDRDAVAHALDHAKIAEGPGGPAEMVPGKRHCRMRMYIATAKNGQFQIEAKSNGLVDPQEC